MKDTKTKVEGNLWTLKLKLQFERACSVVGLSFNFVLMRNQFEDRLHESLGPWEQHRLSVGARVLAPSLSLFSWAHRDPDRVATGQLWEQLLRVLHHCIYFLLLASQQCCFVGAQGYAALSPVPGSGKYSFADVAFWPFPHLLICRECGRLLLATCWSSMVW